MALVTPQIIPLNPVPSQVLDVQLGTQACTLRVYAKTINVPVHLPGAIVIDPPDFATINPVFLDLYVNDVLILGGVLCLNNVALVRDTYLGFQGDLAFTNLLGNADPTYPGLGSQFPLLWWPSLP